MSDGRIDVSITVSPDVDATVDHAVLRDAAVAALQTMQDVEPHPPVDLHASELEISILVTDDAEMQRLNRAYRGVDRPTDILSFSLVADDEGTVQTLPVDATQSLGDIVVSYPYARRQSTELGHSLEMELSWLVIHGVLQLVGYTHDAEDEAEHMEALEHAALQRLGFTVQ
jgi:probable rRNA maturation factor